MSARRAPRARGFTLLEVMAAVLVLGMLYAVLATAAMRGLRSEGESKRRIQASLLADDRLSDLELELALGQIPKSGEKQEQVESFLVDVKTRPVDSTLLMEASIEREKTHPKPKHRSSEQKPMGTGGADTRNPLATGASAATKNALSGLGGAGGANASKGTGSAIDPAVASIGESLLTPPGPGQEGRLREIDVVVRWQEGDQERQITRTTFAFDTSGLEQVFPPKGGADEAGGQAEDIQTMLKCLANPESPECKNLGSGGGGGTTPNPPSPQPNKPRMIP